MLIGCCLDPPISEPIVVPSNEYLVPPPVAALGMTL